jgi:hypothetical protein
MLREIKLILLLLPLFAHADVTHVAKDQQYVYVERPYRFHVVKYAGKVCKNVANRRRTWLLGCYDRGTGDIFITKDRPGVMDMTAEHECEHHVYGPAHTHETYKRMEGDRQWKVKQRAVKQCMLDWYGETR